MGRHQILNEKIYIKTCIAIHHKVIKKYELQNSLGKNDINRKISFERRNGSKIVLDRKSY